MAGAAVSVNGWRTTARRRPSHWPVRHLRQRSAQMSTDSNRRTRNGGCRCSTSTGNPVTFSNPVRFYTSGVCGRGFLARDRGPSCCTGSPPGGAFAQPRRLDVRSGLERFSRITQFGRDCHERSACQEPGDRAGDPTGETTLAWTLAQDLMAFYQLTGPDQSRTRVRELITRLRDCPIPEIGKLGRTLQARRGPQSASCSNTAGSTKITHRHGSESAS